MEYKLIIITIAFLVIPLAVVLFLSSKDTGTLDDMKWNLSQKDTKGKIKYLLGVACCIFAFFDFIFSYGGINLAPFLGGLAVVSPIIFIAVGTILMGTSGKSRQWESSESDEYDAQRTEKSGVELMEEEERKKKKNK